MPLPSAPATAQRRNSGWQPGVVHLEVYVASFGAKKGVDPKTTRGKVQRGLEDLESDVSPLALPVL